MVGLKPGRAGLTGRRTRGKDEHTNDAQTGASAFARIVVLIVGPTVAPAFAWTAAPTVGPTVH